MKRNKWKILNSKWILLILINTTFFTACEPKDEVLFTGNNYENILQYIDRNENEFSKFRKLIEIGHVSDALSSYNNHIGGSNFTLFLPSNEAVDKFIENEIRYGSFEELTKDSSFVRTLVLYHVLNRDILTFDFPNGALPAPTLSNDVLTINFIQTDSGEIIYKINNTAQVLEGNIIKENGIIHKIDLMLPPVAFTAYDWIQNNKSNGFSIFAELLETCGLQDTMNYFEYNVFGNIYYPGYTLFAESDKLYNENGIYSLNDLILEVSPNDNDFTNKSNKLNKFARYHIMENVVFLDQFQPDNYNTFGEFPISVDELAEDLIFNVGTQIFDQIIEGSDTTIIDYLNLDIPNSNIPTKTGPIHQLDQILHPYRPSLKVVDLNFYNEPIIQSLRNSNGNFSLLVEDLQYISLLGANSITYVNSENDITDLQNNDYIAVYGDFEFIYQTPRILAGTYELSLTAHRGHTINAMIQVYIDGKRAGGLLDLTTGNDRGTNYAPSFALSTLTFDESSTHEIKIKTIKPGRLFLDRITLTPVNN